MRASWLKEQEKKAQARAKERRREEEEMAAASRRLHEAGTVVGERGTGPMTARKRVREKLIQTVKY